MAKKDVWYDLIYLGTYCDKKKATYMAAFFIYICFLEITIP
ncbi:hypothetical protein Flavo103_38330 [Flavobacterium collinsii]|nr:hypothetical protein Flavo103_38330 [Flavobacterium collinsii]